MTIVNTSLSVADLWAEAGALLYDACLTGDCAHASARLCLDALATEIIRHDSILITLKARLTLAPITEPDDLRATVDKLTARLDALEAGMNAALKLRVTSPAMPGLDPTRSAT